MCISPNKLADGTLVACRGCRVCRDNKVKDIAGRVIAETRTSRHAYFGLLTYGDLKIGDQGKLKAVVLTYSDVQKYLKRLRKRIGKFKYFVAGEYGGSNDRAHWHVILITDQPLEMESECGDWKKNLKVDGVLRDQGDWHAGYSSFKVFHHEHAYYACKYVFKDKEDNLKTAKHQFSKQPPLGHEYFQDLAQKHVDAGLAPQDLFYTFPEVQKKDGTPIKYMMSGKTAENFLNGFIAKWQAKHGKYYYETYDDYCGCDLFGHGHEFDPQRHKHMPQSQLIEDHIDKNYAAWAQQAEDDCAAAEIRLEMIIRESEIGEEKAERYAESLRRQVETEKAKDRIRRQAWPDTHKKSESNKKFHNIPTANHKQASKRKRC